MGKISEKEEDRDKSDDGVRKRCELGHVPYLARYQTKH